MVSASDGRSKNSRWLFLQGDAMRLVEPAREIEAVAKRSRN